MHYIFIGLNHETTPVEQREKLAFQPNRIGEALARLTQPNGEVDSELIEAVILSTCNRVEIYAIVKNQESGFQKLKNFISEYHGISLADFGGFVYQFVDLAVVEHLFSVTSGLASMVLGETQIQGQVKRAYELAQQHKTIGPFLSGLFRNALTVGKRVRSETNIGEYTLSINHSAVNLIRDEFDNIKNLNFVVIGSEKMSSMTLKILLKHGAQNLTIINRTTKKDENFTDGFDVEVLGFEHLAHSLEQADVVISSTGAPHVILSYETIRDLMRERSDHPLFMIDIAVPRDIEAAVKRLTNVKLVNIDDLKTVIDTNKQNRCLEINRVRDIINEEVPKFLAWQQSLEVNPVITDLRRKTEEIREQELQRALRRLESDLPENDLKIVQDLTRRIVNKILHQPLIRLREEAVKGNGALYTATVRHLFRLEEKLHESHR